MRFRRFFQIIMMLTSTMSLAACIKNTVEPIAKLNDSTESINLQLRNIKKIASPGLRYDSKNSLINDIQQALAMKVFMDSSETVNSNAVTICTNGHLMGDSSSRRHLGEIYVRICTRAGPEGEAIVRLRLDDVVTLFPGEKFGVSDVQQILGKDFKMSTLVFSPHPLSSPISDPNGLKTMTYNFIETSTVINISFDSNGNVNHISIAKEE